MKNIEYFFLSKIKFNFNNLNWKKKEIFKNNGEACRIQEIVQFKDLDEITLSLVKNLIDKIVEKKQLYGSRVEICQFQKTSKGGIFDWHSDYMDGRNCVAVIYLSDFEDGLVGGETEFKNQDYQKIQIITPKKGYCCCFDPKIIHRGSKVNKGIKYTLVVVFNENETKTEFEKKTMGEKKIIY
jgi:hypothetical protein